MSDGGGAPQKEHGNDRTASKCARSAFVASLLRALGANRFDGSADSVLFHCLTRAKLISY